MLFNHLLDMRKFFFQNWAKNVPHGSVGYKTNIDPKNDLTSYIIASAIIMHAVKVIYIKIKKRFPIIKI